MTFTRVNAVLMRNYLWLMALFVLVLSVFIFLEQNNKKYSIILNNKNQLSKQSLHIINQVKDKPLVFDIYTNPKSAIAKKISQFFIPYLRINNKLFINFIDPITHPSEVKSNGITLQGEMVLHYKDTDMGKKIHVTELSETSIVNAILSLLRNKDQWLVVGEGFGMSNIADDSGIGLSGLLIHLKKIGIQVARMPLNKDVVLPENVKVILLPSPTENLGIELVEWLKNQTDNGIGLWWLNDVDLDTQTNMELAFDVMNLEKIPLQGENFTDYVSNFPKHAITKNFNQPIYIAEATGMISDGFVPLFLNDDNTAFALTKQLDNSRLVITGDADFVSNQYLNMAANKSMVVRIVDWILYNDERVNIPLKVNQNTQILLSQNQLLFLSLFFLVMLPLLFVIIAFFQWRKHRER